MKRWQRNLLIGSGVSVVLLGLGYYFAFVESSIPSDAHFALDIAELRRLASEIPGEKPSKIEVERVAAFEAPATAIVAGDGWSAASLPVFSYRVVSPSSIAIIDTALEQSLSPGNLASFDSQSYARVQAAMTNASLIVVTHEHGDHIGGLMAHPQLATLAPRTQLTEEQLAHRDLAAPAVFPKHLLPKFKPLKYDGYHAIAPGMVLIKAVGHTPGSQMVFVQTASGAEFLFLGDVAWHMRNIELQRERARLFTTLMHEDRTAVFGQLVALQRLRAADPKVQIVPGHDSGVVERLISTGALSSGFHP